LWDHSRVPVQAMEVCRALIVAASDLVAVPPPLPPLFRCCLATAIARPTPAVYDEEPVVIDL
jgi:hypothetical protein